MLSSNLHSRFLPKTGFDLRSKVHVGDTFTVTKTVEKKNAEIVKALEELHNKNQSLEKKYIETENQLKAIREILIFFIFNAISKKKIFYII